MWRSLNSGRGPPDSRPQPSPRPVSPGGSRSWTKRRFRHTGKEDRGWSQLTVQAPAELLGPRAHTVKRSSANATRPACSEDREATLQAPRRWAQATHRPGCRSRTRPPRIGPALGVGVLCLTHEEQNQCPATPPLLRLMGNQNQPEKSSPFFPESTYYNGRKNRVMYTHLRFCLLWFVTCGQP